MEQLYRCGASGTSVFLIRGLGSERDEAEREVIGAGIFLPISHRAVWAANLYHLEPWFLLVRDANGRVCGGAAIEQSATRAMPGHKILRLRRTGGNLNGHVFNAMLAGIKVLSHDFPRILRVQVHVFSRNRLEEIGQTLAGYGYRELLPPTVYRHTLVIDLKPSEEEIFAKINTSGRQNIRKSVKNSLKSIAIHDHKYADRLKELQKEALHRTGGQIAGEDWRAVLKLSQERPDLSRVFGLFLGEDELPENMAAFGWVCNHGDHGEYRAAGSTRRADVKIPYGYLVVWDMIRWAKATGADWFDMGGVTVGEGDEAALEGISNFKKSFSRDVAEVGAEWIFEPHPLQARIADAVSEGVQRLRRWKVSS